MRFRRLASAACLLWICAVVPAWAGDSVRTLRELQDLLSNLESTTDSGERTKLVRALATQDHIRAAERLRKIARTDPDPAVRVAAVQGLGASPVREALEFLLELTLEGGPRDVRIALGRAIAKRRGVAELLTVFGKTDDALGRGLLIAALLEDKGLDAVQALERLAGSDDPHLRVESLRALARHPSGKQLVPDVLRDALRKRHDLDTVLACLDVAETLADAQFRALADVLATFLEPEAQAAVDAVRRRLAWLDAAEAAKRARPAGEYATTDDPPPEPPTPRPRVDIVYMFDATGSVAGHVPLIKERIRREAQTLARVGTDFRLGVVAYKDTTRRRGLWATQCLPLTYDLAKALAWIDAIDVGGCDAQGACVTEGLEQALNRMGWRWNATRQVGLIADSKTGDPERSQDLVKLHYQADRTHMQVWYLYRTRAKLPPDIDDLARVGGGIVESLE